MSVLLKGQPDSEFLMVEEHLRFENVDAAMPPHMVPLALAHDLGKAIDILEKKRGWHLLTTLPTHRKFRTPCCDQVAFGKAGSPLKIRFQPSELQGDSDDSHNFDRVSTNTGTVGLMQTGRLDWVAIVHFWQRSVSVDLNDLREWQGTLGPQRGFVTPDQVPRLNGRWKPVPATSPEGMS